MKTILVKGRFLYHVLFTDYNRLKNLHKIGEEHDWDKRTFDAYNEYVEIIEKKYKPLKIDFTA